MSDPITLITSPLVEIHLDREKGVLIVESEGDRYIVELKKVEDARS